jgi:hypothetical protein
MEIKNCITSEVESVDLSEYVSVVNSRLLFCFLGSGRVALPREREESGSVSSA